MHNIIKLIVAKYATYEVVGFENGLPVANCPCCNQPARVMVQNLSIPGRLQKPDLYQFDCVTKHKNDTGNECEQYLHTAYAYENELINMV